ncbi:hypothetical protein HDU83_008202 [Entophlyctis luteolus]|nr:hypothetical protein HDU83_008202 [Entophlyctis luteolus]
MKSLTNAAAAKNEARRLEEQNRKMEERLAALREHLQQERAKRGNAEFIWKRGNHSRGSLNTYASDVLAAKAEMKVGSSVKSSQLLFDTSIEQKQRERFTGIAKEAADELHEHEQKALKRLAQLSRLHSQNTGAAGLDPPADPPSMKKHPVGESSTTTNLDKIRTWQNPIPPEEPTSISASCEHIPKPPEAPLLASLQKWSKQAEKVATAEPENSCSLTSQPDKTTIRIRRARLRPARSPDAVKPAESRSVMPPDSEKVPEKSLLDGEFDELRGRNEFLRALQDWRSGTGCDTPLKSDCTPADHTNMSSSEGTTTSETFRVASGARDSAGLLTLLSALDGNKSLTYLDKLMLHKLRAAPADSSFELLPHKDIVTASDHFSDENDTEDEAAQVFWPLNGVQFTSKPDSDLRKQSVSFEMQVLSTESSGEYHQGGVCIVTEPEF